jgi:integrase-like protein
MQGSTEFIQNPLERNTADPLSTESRASAPHDIRDRVFYGLLTKAKLRRVRFHDLRHTFASLLLQNGESPVYVKGPMGHSSIQITVDCYGHLIPGGNKQTVHRFDTPMPKPAFGVESATPAQPGWYPAPKEIREGIVDQAVIWGRYEVSDGFRIYRTV